MSWFFFSYARINTNPYLKRFYADLWKGLSAQLTAEEQRHKSFADWERLELMSRWSRSLQEALEWSRVLVCMTSRAYVTQEWCGKELAFFERLSRHHQGPQAQQVLPIVWGKTDLPEILSQYQMVQGTMPDAYFELGLARMMGAGNMWPAYRRCVDALVQAILEKGRRIQPRGGIPGKTLAAETSAFIVPNRYRTRGVYCFTGGRDRRPCLPPPEKDESADELVATVVARRQIGLEEIPLTPALADTVLNAGDDPVLILVDPRAAQAPACERRRVGSERIGKGLGSLLRRIGRFPTDKALAGPTAVHEKRVLHRELKPADVMLGGSGQMLPTDFGLAGLAGEIENGLRRRFRHGGGRQSAGFLRQPFFQRGRHGRGFDGLGDVVVHPHK